MQKSCEILADARRSIRKRIENKQGTYCSSFMSKTWFYFLVPFFRFFCFLIWNCSSCSSFYYCHWPKNSHHRPYSGHHANEKRLIFPTTRLIPGNTSIREGRVICLKTTRHSAFLIWSGRSCHVFSNSTQIFFSKFTLAGLNNRHNLMLLATKLIFFSSFWPENKLQLKTKCFKQGEEIKQNRMGTENFDICFYVIFDYFHQSFIWWLSPPILEIFQIFPNFLNP